MPIDTELHYTAIDDLCLDPDNPRLGRDNFGKKLSQEKLLDIMKGWNLEELAVSFLESGFWPQEALMVVEEQLYGQKRLVVVEGNRRLAALILLRQTMNGNAPSKTWQEFLAGKTPAEQLFTKVPYLKASSRQEIQAYLGFRHVTGIVPWDPAEKAEFIARMIDGQKMTYEEVTRKIGSKIEPVRRNYISYRLLLQMEEEERISLKHVEEKFSVLFLSLRSTGVQKYLQIDIQADPEKAKRPVPQEKLDSLAKFALWLFGSEEQNPVITDSRHVDKFGKILESADAVAYLERAKTPKFETAYRLAGGEEYETAELVEQAADSVEEALGTAHHHLKSKRLMQAVERLGVDTMELLHKFPDIKKKVLSEDANAPSS